MAGTIVHALFIAHALFMARALRVALPAFIAASVGSGAMAGELSDIATAAEGAAPDRKPVVGLVLAGGGARGAAHVGVLKVLEELGIHPDLVVGTSMGAIVGGLYATGLSAERLEQIIRRMDWDRVFADDPGRRDRTMRRKQLDREFVIPRRLGFNRTGVQVPLGALHGQHLDTTLKRVIGQTVTVQDFDQLPIRFRAIATDIATGDAVILRSGSLVQALRASMSVPAVFAPVMIDGRLLVDGGLAMNTPVEVAKEMGADIVIVVDLSLPLLPREEIDSMLRVTEQLSNFLTRRNTQASLALLTDDDLLIRPELGNITSIQFERSMEALVLGETAARDALVPLQQLADRVGRSTPPIVAPSRGVTVEFIELNNTSRLDDAILLSRLSLKLGDRLDIEQLESDLNAIYALDVFDAVRYDIVRDPGQGAGVMISADARTWGPNYLQFGLALSSDFDAIQNFSIGSVYTRNAMNRLGADLRVSGAIGRFAGLEIDWYQPLDLNAAWFVQPVLHWNQDRHDLYDGTRHIGTAEIERWGTRLGAGRNLAPKMQVRADYRWAHEAVESISGNVPGEFTGRHRVGELALSARYDSLNNIHFPTRGNLFELTARRSDTRLDGDIDYNQMELTSTTAWTRGRWSLLTRSLIGVSSNDEIPLHSNYRLGGFGRLSGLPPDSLLGRNTALFAVSGQRRIADLRLLPIYAGMSIEGGNLWEDRDDMAFGDLNYSASLYLGIDSFLGPWYLSYGIDDNGNNSFYFYLGNPFELRRR